MHATALVEHRGEHVAAGRVDDDAGDALLPGAREGAARVEVEQVLRVDAGAQVALTTLIWPYSSVT
ncbi:hypothetical protein ACFQZ4_18735 [Catellatospora coxensis]